MLIEFLFGFIFFILPIVGMLITLLLTKANTNSEPVEEGHISLALVQIIQEGKRHEIRARPYLIRQTDKHLGSSWILDTS